MKSCADCIFCRVPVLLSRASNKPWTTEESCHNKNGRHGTLAFERTRYGICGKQGTLFVPRDRVVK